jgi:brefeldin A-inhibited guanine nucleotide-exchange protein
VLFDTLRNHGHLFSPALWERVYDSVLFPLFDYVRHAIDPSGRRVYGDDLEDELNDTEEDAWLYETCTLALQLAVDLFVKFYNSVNPLLKKVLTLLTSFIKRPHQSLAGIGIAAFVRLMSNAGDLFSDERWQEVVLSLKEAAAETLPDFVKIIHGMDDIDMAGTTEEHNTTADASISNEEMEAQGINKLEIAITDAKCRTAVQLLLIQVPQSLFRSVVVLP